RRRHTRFSRDWSSDVCSSDLKTGSAQYASPAVLAGAAPEIVDDVYSFGVIVYQLLAGSLPRAASRWNRRAGPVVSMTRQRRKHEIGRASCRERGESGVVAGSA